MVRAYLRRHDQNIFVCILRGKQENPGLVNSVPKGHGGGNNEPKVFLKGTRTGDECQEISFMDSFFEAYYFLGGI